MRNRRVILITGVSSGIGRTCAEYLAKNGYWVLGTSRDPKKVKPFGDNEDWKGLLEIIKMDVNHNDSVVQGIDFVVKKFGGLKAVINNAGFSLAGSIEDTKMMEAKSQIETNLFGVHRVCRQVLPIMREQGSGHIINISSLAGLVGVPFQGFYSTSKFALEGYTETLKMEVMPFGIKVVLVEPGDFNTPLTLHRQKTKESQEKTIYTNFHKALKAAEEFEEKGDSPQRIAELIERIIETENPKLRYKIGPSSTLVSLKKFIPEKVAEFLVMKSFNLL
jgi:short-subunit dehydrogenase